MTPRNWELGSARTLAALTEVGRSSVSGHCPAIALAFGVQQGGALSQKFTAEVQAVDMRHFDQSEQLIGAFGTPAHEGAVQSPTTDNVKSTTDVGGRRKKPFQKGNRHENYVS